MTPTLNDRQQRFCQEYVIDCNATKAAIRAGYGAKSAGKTASVLLKRPRVKETVQSLQQALAAKVKVDSERIVQELAHMAFSNLHGLLKSGMQLKDLAEIDAEKLKSVSGINITETESKGVRKINARILLHNKLGALKELGRHLGIYEKDNLQKLIESPTIVYPGGDED